MKVILAVMCTNRPEKKLKKKTTVNSAKFETTARALDAFCPLTQA